DWQRRNVLRRPGRRRNPRGSPPGHRTTRIGPRALRGCPFCPPCAQSLRVYLRPSKNEPFPRKTAPGAARSPGRRQGVRNERTGRSTPPASVLTGRRALSPSPCRGSRAPLVPVLILSGERRPIPRLLQNGGRQPPGQIRGRAFGIGLAFRP